jgi:hypothetical protein
MLKILINMKNYLLAFIFILTSASLGLANGVTLDALELSGESFDAVSLEQKSMLTQLNDEHLDAAQRSEIIAKINALGLKLMSVELGRGHTLLETRVQAGENLSIIARRMACSVEILIRLNHISQPDRIFPNMRLLAPIPSRRLVVDKAHFELFLYLDDHLVRIYPVGLGAQGRDTPVGSTSISSSMAKFPAYTDRETGVTYPYGDPLNPVGSRWMGLSMGGGYGIHGTLDETSIGKAKSKGCIRLKREHLEELYEFVRVGDPVLIR